MTPERFADEAMAFDGDGDGKLDRAELIKFAQSRPRPGHGWSAQAVPVSPVNPVNLEWSEADVGAAAANPVVPVVPVAPAALKVGVVAVALVNQLPSVLDVPTLNSKNADWRQTGAR
ncbi:MAG UNVERIFIED_CONTAM: hypothetical protein LVR18_52165 [Planctomycetaceae bacterium]|jgi:hypothetical protein